MAISIDWGTSVISVPKSYLSLVSGVNYTMDTNQFRLDLKALEWSLQGMPFLKTHRHNTEVTLGGLTYARTLEILAPYTITFEDGQYRVTLQGSNNNILDVTNINQVSVSSTNSAGLTNPAADQLWNALRSDHRAAGSFGEGMGNALGLMQHNFLLESTVYNANGLLTAATIRIFATKSATDAATDGGLGEGEIATYSIVAIAEPTNPLQVKEYRVTEL